MLNPSEAHSLPRSRGQALNCTMYILASLFGEKPVKSYFLPLGYQCEKKPDENTCCDYLCVAQKMLTGKFLKAVGILSTLSV